jgi:hypothetical protein
MLVCRHLGPDGDLEAQGSGRKAQGKNECYLFLVSSSLCLEPWALGHEILDDALMAIRRDSNPPAILGIEPENGNKLPL